MTTTTCSLSVPIQAVCGHFGSVVASVEAANLYDSCEARAELH